MLDRLVNASVDALADVCAWLVALALRVGPVWIALAAALIAYRLWWAT